MFFSICRFIFCALICPFWLLAAQGEEAPTYPVEHTNPIDYFLDTIFENADCECQGNGGCTRGCGLASDSGDSHPLPIRKCERKKPIRRSSATCAKHVTGAIMAVINKFLMNQCKNTHSEMFKNITYTQCLKNFDEDVRNNNVNICRYGFRFDYAFCMLNLDGQSHHLYDTISNKNVKSTCKRWNPYNQLLLAVDASPYYREMILIPFFKKISPDKYKEFQKDTSKIPEGSIIVTRLYSSEGHVEVKTNRSECGKDKNQTCFCSDHCNERPKYPRPILAIFEWNPEFIHYVSMDNFVYF